MEIASVIWDTEAESEPSMAMTNPRPWCADRENSGGERGGEILASTRILLRIGIDWTMASRDLGCEKAGEPRAAEEVWRGGRVRESG